MTRKKWCLIAAAVLGIGAGGVAAINPIANQYIAPMVQEQLHTSLNGTVQYDSLSVDWNGDVRLHNVIIKDLDNHLVAAVPDATVTLKWSALPSIIGGSTSGAGMVGSVTLEEPDIHVWQLADGSWNVNSLINPSEDSTKKSFDGDVIIHQGTTKIRLANGNTHSITHLDAALAINIDALSKGALSGSFDNQPVKANGSIDMNETDNFDLYVESPHIDIAPFMQFIPLKQNVTLDSGAINDVKVQISSKHGVYSVAGNLQFDGVKGSISNGDTMLAITDGHGRVFLQDKNILISRSAFNVNEQTIKANGLVDISHNDVGLNINVVADAVDVGAFTNHMVSGTVGGRAHISGTSVSPVVTADVKSNALSYNGYTIDGAEAKLMYSNGIATVKQGTVFIGDGSVKASGQYTINSGDFTGSCTIHNVNIASLGANLPEPISGVLNGSIDVRGTQNTLRSVEGNVRGTSIIARGIEIDSVEASFTQRDNATALALSGFMGQGQFSGYGTLQDGSIDLSVSGDALELSRFSGLVGAHIDGQINANAVIRGSLTNPVVNGSISSGEVHYGGARFNSILADVSLEDSVVTIDNGRIADGNGQYTVAGTFDINNKQMQLQANAKAVRIENLIRPFTDLPLTGWLESENTITGTVDNPHIQGASHLYDGSLYGKLISDARITYSVDNQVITFPSITVQGYGATITGSGTASQEAINLDFEANDIDTKRLLINTGYDVDGLVSAKGRIQGSVANPKFYGLVNSKALTINGETISNIFGMLYIDKTVINSENLSFDEENGGHYKAKGGMSLVGEHRLFGSLDVQGGRINNLLDLIGKPVPNLDGALSGNVDISGTQNNPSVHVTGTIRDVVIDKNIVGDATIDAGLENRRFTIKTMKLPVGDGVVAAGGTMDLDGDSDIQIALRNVDVKPFLPLVGKDINATGTITGVVNVTGKTRNPKVELSASLANGSFNGIAIDNAFALATMEDYVIQIQRIQGAKGPYKLSAYGKIPLAAVYESGYMESTDKRSMDVTIDFNEADMAVIPLLSPSVKDATGPLKGVVHITGSVDQPEAYGTVSVRNGTIKVDTLGNTITNVDGDLIFSGQQGDFQSRFTMGKGSAGLAAKVNWEGHSVTDYRLAAQLDGIDPANEYVSGPIRGELYIADRQGIPTLIGDIQLENDKFKIPLSYESSESTQNIGMDVTIHAGKNVRLYDRSLYDMYIQGDVHFGGSVFNPQAQGQFNVTNGVFKYLSHTFTITKGSANFANGSYLPRLQLDAETSVNNYTVMLAVKGTVDQMDLSLKSDPPLPRNQIISMITFGRGTATNSSAISNEDANAVAVAGVQMFAFGYVQETLQNTLGLDRVNITTGSIDPDEPTNRETAGNYNIEIGKYLLPKVMVTYTQGINNHQNKYGVEYSVKRNLKFTGWHTSQGSTYLGGRWSREF